MEEKTDSPQSKNSIESLGKDEIIQKYKGLLNIAKKAKQAKDELAIENQKLKETLSQCETQKEADKKALLTMKEMLDEFTANKLEMVTKINELEKQRQHHNDNLTQLEIENESLKRQLSRLNEDNENLLQDIDRMENQLKQVNILGLEQKENLKLLETEVNKLKEAESLNATLKSQLNVTLEENKMLKEKENETTQALEQLSEKYKSIKEINTAHRIKFNNLKERFNDVLRKLKKVKECKRILLETQHEYADAISIWQKEIIKASKLLYQQMDALRVENDELLRKLNNTDSGDVNLDVADLTNKLQQLKILSDLAANEQTEQFAKFERLLKENERLNENLNLALNSNATQTDDALIDRQKLDDCLEKLLEIKVLSEAVSAEEQIQKQQLLTYQTENERLSVELNEFKSTHVSQQDLEKQKLEGKCLTQELHDLKIKLKDTENILEMLKADNNHSNIVNIAKESVVETEKEQHCHTNELDSINSNDMKNNTSSPLALVTELENYKKLYEELKTRYQLKEKEHADLLDEMRELNEALKARGDVISRQLEKQQELINDLKETNSKLQKNEAKLNDRENILIEKKQELHNITNDLNMARQRIMELEAINTQNEEQMRILNLELLTLRNGELQTDNQSDVLSTSTISRADELNRMRDVDDSFEDKYNKLRTLAVKLKKKLQDQNNIMMDMEKQLESNNSLKKDLTDMQQKFTDLNLELERTQKQTEALKIENQKLKSSRKQSNVLNLEIEAAEKSLSDATTKLHAKIAEMEILNEALTSKENTNIQLRKEISILESAKEAESQHSRELKEQIDLLQQQIKDAVHSKQNIITANKDMENINENLKFDIEELRLQLANSASHQEKQLAIITTEKEQLELKFLHIEENFKDTQKQLLISERALEDLRIEYVDYKMKAQAVLRKNQTKETTKERELEEELIELRGKEKQLQTNNQLQLKKLENNDKEISLLKEDNENQKRRIQEMLNCIEEIRQQNETLAIENRMHLQQHQESLRNHRKQIENMNQCHREQLDDLLANNERKLEQLQKENAKLIRRPPIIGATKTTSAVTTNGTQASSTIDETKLDMILMEREDAEGSEEAAEALATLATLAAKRKISTSRRRSLHEFLPLDELLNLPMNAINDTVTTISANSLGRPASISGDSNNLDNVYIELDAAKENLQKQESHVRHLTALLAENEQDLARLTQMNDMLKEELRRQERSVEREKHMHNSEYLKNVIVKFLTLNNGDERTRLVPVLNTILKLSRSETEILNCVARGQKIPTDGNNSNRSWGNFLTSWTSGGPQ